MDPKIEKSLRISWQEGIPASVMLGILDYYLVPFGLFLGASTRGIGLLVALPQLLASVAQLAAVEMVHRVGSRLRFIVGMAAAQAATLVPMAVLALVAAPGRVAALIVLAVLFRVLNNLIGTAWGSLTSEYLPAEKRGSYFGWRSQVVGVASLAGVAVGGFLLHRMEGISLSRGFFLIFLLATGMRFVSAVLLARMADLPWSRVAGSDFTFVMFLRRFRKSNFVRFVLYAAALIFATNLAAPFFNVYMLRDLRFNYLTYMGLNLMVVLAGLMAFPIWGQHADVVGNVRILKTIGWIVPFFPFLWLVSPSPWYLAGVQLVAGFVWGGFTLCSTNFVFDAVTPEKRVRCLGYFNLFQGLAIFLGALIGGFVADHLPPIRGHSLLTLFAISGLLRMGVQLALSGQFQEVRTEARPVSSLRLFFSVVGMRPVVGQDNEWGVFPLTRRLRKRSW